MAPDPAAPIPEVDTPNTVTKPGIRTTEFWMSVALFLLGVFLMSKGKDEVGAALMGASGFGYTMSRGMAKKAASVLLLCVVLAGAGCTPSGYVKASELRPLVERVVKRHDDYVKADKTLTAAESKSCLLSTELIREALKPPEEGK